MRQHIRAGLLCAALAGSTLALTPAAHAEGAARDYTLTDCDIQVEVTQWTPDRTVTKSTAEIASWTTRISLDLPNPLPAGEWAEVDYDLGPIETDFLPFDLASSVTAEYGIALVDHDGAAVLPLAGDDEYAAIADDSTLDFAPHASTVQAQAGARELRPREVTFAFAGADETGQKWAEVRGACDPLVSAPALMTQYVYDLDAPTDLVTSTPTPVPGRELAFTAYNLLQAAPSTAGERIPATVTLGGRPMGTFPLDASGTVTGAFTVPCCLYGAQELRVVNGSRVASTSVVLPESDASGPTGPQVSLRETFPARVAKGKRATGTVKVSTPRGFSGTVQVLEGTKLLGTAKVVAGTSRRVTLKKLARGRHRLTLVWTGSDRYPGYQPTTRSFVVLQR
ncbi:Ig-like domain repeat protein [Nocardioides daeguensis]|uniref:Bacterial Ig-like domain-containing protein n=1 Tax=Nocardioides daeguensis TaxID=908359 RepID=A0ABP6UT55_9ACTN|nr:hypothetical protein [Nocardioides daeguensis]MBV6728290.1 hypothetical protein [Nocardioides daeguensis]MCR1773099.1 hypothetical protein [Nocardioides daeguensis]